MAKVMTMSSGCLSVRVSSALLPGVMCLSTDESRSAAIMIMNADWMDGKEIERYWRLR